MKGYREFQPTVPIQEFEPIKEWKEESELADEGFLPL